VSRAIAGGVTEALTSASVPHTIQWVGSMFSVFFRDGAVTNYDEARDQDTDAFRRFFHAMLDQGVHLPPSAFECWFVSAAHDDAAVARVLEALPAAARAAASPSS
jgi:glutamate-1-semialdehyde 2,1-aminomutase